MKGMFWALLLLVGHAVSGQQIVDLVSKEKVSLRGLSVVDDKIIWVSGSGGHVALSTDGGKNWLWHQVQGFEQTDFRDIEAFDNRTAVIMGIGEPGVILKTFNGGESWKQVYTDSAKGIFFDAMEFWRDGNGIVVGDPIDGKVYVARTPDFGNTWYRYFSNLLPKVVNGEAMFASSGTNIRRLNDGEGLLVTGGHRSRLLVHQQWVDVPLLQGSTTTGANSLAVWPRTPNKVNIYVVGGDFMRDTLTSLNAAYTLDLGKTWKLPEVPPHGYRSCVEFIDRKKMISCGTSGVDISEDGGRRWRLISSVSYHVVRKAKTGNTVFLAGSRGRVAKLVE